MKRYVFLKSCLCTSLPSFTSFTSTFLRGKACRRDVLWQKMESDCLSCVLMLLFWELCREEKLSTRKIRRCFVSRQIPWMHVMLIRKFHPYYTCLRAAVCTRTSFVLRFLFIHYRKVKKPKWWMEWRLIQFQTSLKCAWLVVMLSKCCVLWLHCRTSRFSQVHGL